MSVTETVFVSLQYRVPEVSKSTVWYPKMTPSPFPAAVQIT